MYGLDGMLIGVDGEISFIGSDIDGGELFEFGLGIDLLNFYKDEDVLKVVCVLVVNELEFVV